MELVSAGPNRCAIIIPVYNEERVIADTVERMLRITQQIAGWEFDITCVNDGSSDGTAAILNGLSGIRVITHEVNRGYGAALRTGLDNCRSEWVYIVDADATYPLEDLPRLLAEAERGADMVVGAREGEGIDLKPFHRIARWTLRKMAHALSGTMVPDLNSGMRVFRYRLYREFRSILPRGFSFTTTITLASLYSNYPVVYIPIEYKKRVGDSSIRPMRDFFSFIMLIVRIASYFEPLRFFLPLAFGIMGLGFFKGFIDFARLGAIGSLAVIMFLMGVQVMITGILAEVIVRRSTPGPIPSIDPVNTVNDDLRGRLRAGGNIKR